MPTQRSWSGSPTLDPRVAALRIRGRRGESAGSAVVLSDEGHLVTNAHVVGDATGGEAEFADGTVARFEVVGTTRSATWRSSCRRAVPARRSTATPTPSGWVNSSWPSATRSGWPDR